MNSWFGSLKLGTSENNNANLKSNEIEKIKKIFCKKKKDKKN